jgi:hypothetical protein
MAVGAGRQLGGGARRRVAELTQRGVAERDIAHPKGAITSSSSVSMALVIGSSAGFDDGVSILGKRRSPTV